MQSALLLSLFITMLLPYLAKAPLAFAMQKSGGYDNHHPRAQQATLRGFGQRANAAHYNSFEALLIYATAVFIVLITGTTDSTAVTLGWLFVASRILYLFCYWLDYATVRSITWIIGMVLAFSMAGRAVLS